MAGDERPVDPELKRFLLSWGITFALVMGLFGLTVGGRPHPETFLPIMGMFAVMFLLLGWVAVAARILKGWNTGSGLCLGGTAIFLTFAIVFMPVGAAIWALCIGIAVLMFAAALWLRN